MINSVNYQGKLLISMPHIKDDLFGEAVILILEHSSDIVMGVIINKPDALSRSELNHKFDLNLDEKAFVRLNIMNGGPVYLKELSVLYKGKAYSNNTQEIMPELYATTSSELINQIAHEDFEGAHLVIHGLSIWSPTQLVEELKQNTWMLFPFDEAIVFDEDHASKWLKLYSNHGINLTNIHPEIGQA